MPEHEFTVRLVGVPAVTDEVESAVWEAGCDDATLFSRDGGTYLIFSRAAPTRAEAVASALRDVRAAGLTADLLEPAAEAA